MLLKIAARTTYERHLRPLAFLAVPASRAVFFPVEHTETVLFPPESAFGATSRLARRLFVRGCVCLLPL